MKTSFTILFAFVLLAPVYAWSQLSSSPIPNFTATVLTGEKINSAQLIGRPTILIVTPSTDAALDTRLWVEALPTAVDQSRVRIIGVIVIDLPFFMSKEDAILMAKKKIPMRYQEQTWILTESNLESAMNIPSSSPKAFVFVLNAQGSILTRVEGKPNNAKLMDIKQALRSIE